MAIQKYLLIITAVVFVLTGIQNAKAQKISDEAITEEIERQFYDNTSLSAQMVDIETKEGIVTMSGTVNSLITQERIKNVAMATRGVRGIIDKITINPPSVSDTDLKARIEAALAEDPATDAYEIDFVVKDGVVKLLGNVDSWQEKILAEDVTKKVKGVVKVQNDIAFVYKADRPDREIKADIKRRLRADVRVDDAQIKVKVDDGNVKLKGKVGSAAEKSIAEVDAWVANVYEVDVTDLEVAPYIDDKKLIRDKYIDKSDMTIHQAIMDAFKYDARVNPFDIEVKVDDGNVILRGTVDNLMARKAAKMDAKNIVGVIRVDNNIKVRPDKLVDDAILAEKVKSKLLKDPNVGFFDIEVHASNGKVYLKGEVSSVYEKLRAGYVASKTKGVASLQNMIESQGVKYPEVEVDAVSYAEEQLITPAFTANEDLDLQRAVERQIWWSPFVDHDDVVVNVENGEIQLNGTVDSKKEKQYAELNAVQAGGSQINNNLLID